MDYSEIKKHQWFELLQSGYNPYNYERFLYNTGIIVAKGRKEKLYLEISKNSNHLDYGLHLVTLQDGFWIEHRPIEIEYKNPPKPIKELNKIFIKTIFEDYPLL
jgi:hypothetical protein